MHFNEIRGAVVDAAMKVHSALGLGYWKTCTKSVPGTRIEQARLSHRGTPAPSVNYDGQRIDLGFRIDILVESTVVVEIKAVDAITPVHQAQLITFLKLSRKHVGLRIKFNVVHLRDGIRRMVCGEPPSVSSVVKSLPST